MAQALDNLYEGKRSKTVHEPTRSMQEVIMELMGMGHIPLAKKNGTGADYIDTLHNDTYEFINPKQFDLEGRAVFITGASRGLGRAFAVSYAKAGASYIAIGARSSLDEVQQEIQDAARSAGREAPQVLSLKLDVTSKESVAQAAKEVDDAFGRCDILINNSGFMETTSKMTEVDPDERWKTFETNIFGMFLMSRAFIPMMVKKDGLKTIVNLTSMWGTTWVVGGSAYQLTKFATMRFSEMCNSEYGDQGILSYSLHPGGVETELGRHLQADFKQFLIDTPEMGADTIVWLTAERREWLAGRYVSATWNMKELLDKREKLVEEDHLKMRLMVGGN